MSIETRLFVVALISGVLGFIFWKATHPAKTKDTEVGADFNYANEFGNSSADNASDN